MPSKGAATRVSARERRAERRFASALATPASALAFWYSAASRAALAIDPFSASLRLRSSSLSAKAKSSFIAVS